MKNFRKTKRCDTCRHCEQYKETKHQWVGVRSYMEYHEYLCGKTGLPLETPAIIVCDEWEEA